MLITHLSFHDPLVTVLTSGTGSLGNFYSTFCSNRGSRGILGPTTTIYVFSYLLLIFPSKRFYTFNIIRTKAQRGYRSQSLTKKKKRIVDHPFYFSEHHVKKQKKQKKNNRRTILSALLSSVCSQHGSKTVSNNTKFR